MELQLIFKFWPYNFFGEPRPGVWCVLAILGRTLARVKISGASNPRGRNVFSRKSRLG